MLFLLFPLTFSIRQSDNEPSFSRSAHYVPLFLHLQNRQRVSSLLCHLNVMKSDAIIRLIK